MSEFPNSLESGFVYFLVLICCTQQRPRHQSVECYRLTCRANISVCSSREVRCHKNRQCSGVCVLRTCPGTWRKALGSKGNVKKTINGGDQEGLNGPLSFCSLCKYLPIDLITLVFTAWLTRWCPGPPVLCHCSWQAHAGPQMISAWTDDPGFSLRVCLEGTGNRLKSKSPSGDKLHFINWCRKRSLYTFLYRMKNDTHTQSFTSLLSWLEADNAILPSTAESVSWWLFWHDHKEPPSPWQPSSKYIVFVLCWKSQKLPISVLEKHD